MTRSGTVSTTSRIDQTGARTDVISDRAAARDAAGTPAVLSDESVDALLAGTSGCSMVDDIEQQRLQMAHNAAVEAARDGGYLLEDLSWGPNLPC